MGLRRALVIRAAPPCLVETQHPNGRFPWKTLVKLIRIHSWPLMSAAFRSEMFKLRKWWVWGAPKWVWTRESWKCIWSFYYRCVGLVGCSQREKVFLSMRGCCGQFPYRAQTLWVLFDRKKELLSWSFAWRDSEHTCVFLSLHSFHLSISGAEVVLVEVRIVQGVLFCAFL